MRGFRGQAQAYMPPHATDRDQSSRPVQSLGDLEYSTLYWKVELQGASSTVSYSRCPAHLATDLAADTPPDTAVLLFPGASSDEDAEDLLEWFREEACTSNSMLQHVSDSGPCMKLPAHVSKEQRAHWHRLAQGKGLMSQSQGVGANRQLQIMCPSARHVCSGVSQRARQVWEWCQQEGGRMWSISQGEVAAMLQAGGHTPPEVQQLIKKRELSQQLAQLLQARHADAALDMLSAEPSLAWVRDDESGGYPLHIAVWHNLSQVITMILSQPNCNVTEQRDRRRDTPLMLAKKRGLTSLEDMLLAAGANDIPCNPSPGCTAWSAGQVKPYNSLSQPSRKDYNDRKSNSRPSQHVSASVQAPPGLSRVTSWDGPPGFNQ